MTRVFHAPSSIANAITVQLVIDSHPSPDSILLNGMSIPWCKMASRLVCDVTTLLQPTNRLAVILQRNPAVVADRAVATDN
jgi:hypothetical protein